jgi:Protein of unknown function (DUF2975)
MQTGDAYEPSSQTGVMFFLVDLAWTLFVVFIVVIAVGAAIGIARGETNVVLGDSLSVKADLVRSDLQQLPDGVLLTSNPHVSVEVTSPTRKQVLLSTVMGLGKAALVGFVLWFLRGLARTAKEGDPFVAANVRRLRGIGFTLAFGGPLVALLDGWAGDSLLSSLPASARLHLTRAGFAFPLELILAGMGAFILAAVFAYGVRLREDVEATV